MSQEQILGYYRDAGLKERMPTNINGNVKADWGIVDQGETKKLTFYIKNEHPRKRPISFAEPKYPDKRIGPFSDNPAVKILDYPKALLYNASGPVTMEYTAPADSIDPLESTWGFRIAVG